MFRLNAVPNFKVNVPSGDGFKVCRLRFPADAEWCERMRKIKVIRTAIGRDLYETDIPNRIRADAELFDKIRVDEGDSFDDYEKAAAIAQLESCEVINIERMPGLQYRVDLLPSEGSEETCIHFLKIPSQRDRGEYSDVHFRSGRKHQEMISSLEPAGILYDKYVVSSEGYAAAVPITHKYAVVKEVMDQASRFLNVTVEVDDPEA